MDLFLEVADEGVVVVELPDEGDDGLGGEEGVVRRVERVEGRWRRSS